MRSKLKYIIIGIILILLIYTLYYKTVVYVNYFNEIPRKVRHIARLVSIILVYAVGYFSYKKYGVKWMTDLWQVVYLVTILLLVLIGLYDWGFGPASMQIRNVAKTLHEFLISPVLYLGIVIINRVLVKSGNTNG